MALTDNLADLPYKYEELKLQMRNFEAGQHTQLRDLHTKLTSKDSQIENLNRAISETTAIDEVARLQAEKEELTQDMAKLETTYSSTLMDLEKHDSNIKILNKVTMLARTFLCDFAVSYSKLYFSRYD